MRDLGPSCFTEGPVRYWSQKGKLGFAPRPVRPQSQALCKAPVNPNPVWPPGPDSVCSKERVSPAFSGRVGFGRSQGCVQLVQCHQTLLVSDHCHHGHSYSWPRGQLHHFTVRPRTPVTALTGGPARRRSESLGFVPVWQKFLLRPRGRGNSLNKTILDASGTRNGSDLAPSPREPLVYFKGERQPAEGQSQRKGGTSRARPRAL